MHVFVEQQAPTEPPQDQASCGSSQDEAPSRQGSSLPASRQQQDDSSPHPVSSHSSSNSSNSSPSLHASLARESISSDQQTADELLQSTSIPRPAIKKRRRQQHLDDCFSEQMARIDKRRTELSEILQKDDKYDRFGRILADLLRKVPEQKQVVARRNLLARVCDLLEN
ncbi:osteocalcin 2-like [Nothobranchius furzeri]|uniref:osteocalcin 2-like n=1 Tax=Nothobranchius furzeri TaxID=105023 RepID=UPI003904C0D8